MQTTTEKPDTLDIATHIQTAPPPAESKPANGAGNPEHLAAPPANAELLHQNEEITRKLASIETLGRQVIAKGGEVSKQTTECAKIKANLDDEREKLHKLERERDELQEELTMLATGKQSERLPFKEPTAAKDAKPAPAAAADDWKSVTLEAMGIKTKRVLTALCDHEPAIVTHGDLAAWQQKKGDFWAKDIKKLGDKGREEIENAQQAYWLANPQPKAEAKPGESFDDAAIIPETETTIVNRAGGMIILQLQVAQRKSGRWAAGYACSIAGMKGDSGRIASNGYEGSCRNEAEATIWAAGAIDAFARNILSNKPKKKIGEAAKEIRRILNRVDKQIALDGRKQRDEVLPDPKAQAEADVANTKKDNAAKRARKRK